MGVNFKLVEEDKTTLLVVFVNSSGYVFELLIKRLSPVY